MGVSLSGLPRFDRSSTMTAQVIVARQFDPSINRSAQCIAVIVNGLDATLVGRGAKVSVDRPNLRTSASTSIRKHYSSAVPWDASCASESGADGPQKRPCALDIIGQVDSSESDCGQAERLAPLRTTARVRGRTEVTQFKTSSAFYTSRKL